MAEKEKKRSKPINWLGLLSFGFFLVLLGTIWIITPNLTREVRIFVEDFELKNVTESIALPAPENEHEHLVVYTAAMQFCFVFGIFQVVILALRFFQREPWDRIRGTLSGMVFWLSAGFFLNMLASETIGWFGLLAGLIVSIGLMIITSGIVRLFTEA